MCYFTNYLIEFKFDPIEDRPIPPEIINSIDDMVDSIKNKKKYLLYLKHQSKVIYKHLLGKVKIYDKEIPVYIGECYQENQICVPYGDLDTNIIKDILDILLGT